MPKVSNEKIRALLYDPLVLDIVSAVSAGYTVPNMIANVIQAPRSTIYHKITQLTDSGILTQETISPRVSKLQINYNLLSDLLAEEFEVILRRLTEKKPKLRAIVEGIDLKKHLSKQVLHHILEAYFQRRIELEIPKSYVSLPLLAAHVGHSNTLNETINGKEPDGSAVLFAWIEGYYFCDLP